MWQFARKTRHKSNSPGLRIDPRTQTPVLESLEKLNGDAASFFKKQLAAFPFLVPGAGHDTP